VRYVNGPRNSEQLSAGSFSKQNEPVQTAFFYAAHESLGIRVQIRTSRGQFDGFHIGVLQRAQKFVREQRIAIMNQIALAGEQPFDAVGQVASNLAHPPSVRRG